MSDEIEVVSQWDSEIEQAAEPNLGFDGFGSPIIFALETTEDGKYLTAYAFFGLPIQISVGLGVGIIAFVAIVVIHKKRKSIIQEE